MVRPLRATSIPFFPVIFLIACFLMIGISSSWVSSVTPSRRSAPQTSDTAAITLSSPLNFELAPRRQFTEPAALGHFSKLESGETNNSTIAEVILNQPTLFPDLRRMNHAENTREMATSINASSPVAGTGTGLRGDYFNNMSLADPPALTRTDPTVDFAWGSGSPATGINIDQFSTRWTGQLQAQFTEPYTFFIFSDDGVRLWVNGQPILDRWFDQFGPESASQTIGLVAGQKYEIKLEYYENWAGAEIHLAWNSPSTFKQLIPQSQLYPPTSAPAPNYGGYLDGADCDWILPTMEVTLTVLIVIGSQAGRGTAISRTRLSA